MMNALPSASNRRGEAVATATRGRFAHRDGRAVLVDDQVRQVAGVRPVRVVQAVLVAERVVVATRGGERRRARPDGVDVDAVQPGGQALDLDVDVDVPRASSVRPTQPTTAPDASTNVALAWFGAGGPATTEAANEHGEDGAGDDGDRERRVVGIWCPSSYRVLIYHDTLYRDTIYSAEPRPLSSPRPGDASRHQPGRLQSAR